MDKERWIFFVTEPSKKEVGYRLAHYFVEHIVQLLEDLCTLIQP
jgi:hypothetical protein